LSSEPSIALLLAAVNFEWTISRAVLFLSTTKNTALRQKLRDYYSPDKYKELWKEEVVPHGHLSLAKLVRNWSSVLKGFDARNVIVHGKDRYTKNMATPHVEALLEGARFVDTYCQDHGKPLYERMPVRKKSAS
jgi:hypothetical protein